MLVVLMALKRLGIINFDFEHSASGTGGSAALTPSAFSRGKAQCPELNQDMTHRGKIIAHGSAPYMFDETKRLNCYITLCSEHGEDKAAPHCTGALLLPLYVNGHVELEYSFGKRTLVFSLPGSDRLVA